MNKEEIKELIRSIEIFNRALRNDIWVQNNGRSIKNVKLQGEAIAKLRELMEELSNEC